MKNIDKVIEILQAYKEGKTVEIKWDTGWEKCYYDEDLFYAFNEGFDLRIIKKEPTYRPYASSEEFLQASKEHGPYIKRKNIFGGYLYIPIIIDNNFIIVGQYAKAETSFIQLLKDFVWQDRTPCGVLEE